MSYKMVILLSFVLAVVFTFPAIFHLFGQYIGDGYDNYEYASYMGLAAKHIQLGSFPFVPTDYWRYPAGFDFPRAFDSYLTVTLGTVLTLIFSLPLGYNLTILFLMTLNGFFSYLFFERLSRSRLIGVIGMVLYGFSFYNLAKAASHPNLLLTGVFAFLGWSVLGLIQKEKYNLRDYFWFFLNIILVLTQSIIYGLFLVLFGLMALTIVILINKQLIFSLKQKVNDSRRLFLSFIIFTLLFLLLIYFPHLKALMSNQFCFLDRSKTLFELSPSLLDFLLPNTYLKIILAKFVSSPSLPSIEKAVFIGFAEIAFFLAFFLTRVSGKIKLFLGLGFLIPFVLALGYGKDNQFFLLPYHFLANIFPFSLVATPGRFFPVFYLFITVSIALLLVSLNKYKIGRLIIVVFLILIILERLPYSFYLAETFKNEPYYDLIKKENTKAVLDIPVNIFHPRYNILSFYYRKAIVNGYFHWSADGTKEKAFIQRDGLISRYSCSDLDPIITRGLSYPLEDGFDKDMLKLLKEFNIATLVVHKDDKFYHPVCTNVRLRLGRFLPFVQELQETGMVEKQIANQALEGKPSFTFYFPKDGTFYLDGFYLAPSNQTSFILTLDNKPVDFSYGWTIKNDYTMELTPKYTIVKKVPAGSILTAYSPYDVNHTEFSLWYRYVADKNAKVLPYNPPISKIYEDENTIVYHVN